MTKRKSRVSSRNTLLAVACCEVEVLDVLSDNIDLRVKVLRSEPEAWQLNWR